VSHDLNAPAAPRKRDFPDGLLSFGGLALHLIVGVFPFSASGLLAPLWAVIVLGLVWLAGLVIAIRLVRSRPRLVPLVPLVALVFWAGLMLVGDLLLDWTA